MTGYTLSSCVVWKLSRVGNNAGDTYDDVVSLIEFDIHYEVDGFGSEDEYVKN